MMIYSFTGIFRPIKILAVQVDLRYNCQKHNIYFNFTIRFSKAEGKVELYTIFLMKTCLPSNI